MKRTCNLAIDQVGGEEGGTGYGKNSIENFSMGLPTITEFTDDYLNFLKDNPFIHSSIGTLKKNISFIIDNPSILKEYSYKAREWVVRHHSFKAVNEKLMELYKKYNII